MAEQAGESYVRDLNTHYGSANLGERLLEALQREGKDPNALTREDLGAFDQNHIGGGPATRTLAKFAGLRAGDHVLDVGCGLGGSARMLADEFGCTVVGLEVTDAYRQAAEMLTQRVGMGKQVSFRTGNALALPFDDASFDVVWMQHVAMNIPDKRSLFSEAARVLKPGGTLAVHTILAGMAQPIHYPVVWAVDAGLNFLEPAAAFRSAIEAGGFEVLEWQDVTEREIGVYRSVIAWLSNNDPSELIFSLFVDDILAKGNNTMRNLEEGRIGVAQVLGRKGG